MGLSMGKLLTKENFLQVVLLLGAITLSLDTWLFFDQQSSLCTTSDCQIVGQYVRLGEQFLIVVGGAFFWLLWAVVFFACRYKKPFLWNLAMILIFGGLAFDGVLLGYQVFGLDLKCHLCFGVGLCLWIGLGGFAWVRRSLTVFVLGGAVFLGSVSANALLLFTPRPPKLQEIAFCSRPAQEEFASKKYFLFFSFRCAHCTEVLVNLAVNKPWQGNWYLISIDNTRQGMMKLARVLDSPLLKENPFVPILKIKAKDKIENFPVQDSLHELVKEARAYFSFHGYRAIPLLVVHSGAGKEVILHGSDSIAKYLWENGLIHKWLSLKKIRDLNN